MVEEQVLTAEAIKQRRKAAGGSPVAVDEPDRHRLRYPGEYASLCHDTL